jgi:hypothetical protein
VTPSGSIEVHALHVCVAPTEAVATFDLDSRAPACLSTRLPARSFRSRTIGFSIAPTWAVSPGTAMQRQRRRVTPHASVMPLPGPLGRVISRFYTANIWSINEDFTLDEVDIAIPTASTGYTTRIRFAARVHNATTGGAEITIRKRKGRRSVRWVSIIGRSRSAACVRACKGRCLPCWCLWRGGDVRIGFRVCGLVDCMHVFV